MIASALVLRRTIGIKSLDVAACRSSLFSCRPTRMVISVDNCLINCRQVRRDDLQQVKIQLLAERYFIDIAECIYIWNIYIKCKYLDRNVLKHCISP